VSTITVHGSPKLPTDLIVRECNRDGVRVERIPLRPQGGDLVRWADGTTGMIDDCTGGTPDRLSVVSKMTTASVHLLDNGKVSISGGPFRFVDRDHLRDTGIREFACFWNWGNRTPRAHEGVDFILARPVWEYIGPNHWSVSS
jgi:hypothetical protein